MDSGKLVESFAEFARSKNIDRATVVKVLEEVFRIVVLSKFGKDDNFDIIVNLDKGDLQIWRFREIVANDADDIADYNKVSLAEAQSIEADFEVGEELAEEIKLASFGRRAVMILKQALNQKIKELAKDAMYQKYLQLVGSMVTVEVNQFLSRETIVIDEEGNELFLPKTEQIPKDRFKKGKCIRALIHKVELYKSAPRVLLSRTTPQFLACLLESEIPEIQDGLIAIKNIVREPGERAKVAVESYDDRVDPVGACVGKQGSRIHGITRELQYENIDIIDYINNESLYIARALSPANVSKVAQCDAGRIAVYLKPDQVSLAIGKGGQNIKLASKLIGKEIDVFRELDGQEEDIALEEFSDAIEQWVIDELKKIGFDTARSVLAMPKETLEERVDLEKETIDDVYEILRNELDGS